MQALQAGSQTTPSLEEGEDTEQQEKMLERIGHLTRSLHENLLALGLDGVIERVANDMPDARQRLDYVAKMTEQSAQRVLNATDSALPLQQKIETDVSDMMHAWQAAMDAPFSESQYRALAKRTMVCLEHTKAASSETREQLLAIMMAQDFQDLTGQVIKKITTLAHELETQLVQLLVDYAPAQVDRQNDESGLLNGPQINPEGKKDVVASQQQVDDLLESLGF
jgi:chemotaxis protein CheZ